MPLAKVNDSARTLFVSWQKKVRGVTDPSGWVRELDLQLEALDVDKIVPMDDTAEAGTIAADARECTEATDFLMVWTAEYRNAQERNLKERRRSELLWALHTLQGGATRFALWGAPLEDIRNLKHVRVGEVFLSKVERLAWLRDSVFPFDGARQQEITGAICEALQKFLDHQFK